MSDTQVESAPPPSLTRRLYGLDVARAVAFVGMLLAHYVGPHRPGDPGWLVALDATADGRAAPLFCVLLGVGAGLLVARGTPDRVLVRRGTALFVLGVLIWPIFDRVYLILPQYGVLLALVPVLRRLPHRALLAGAAVAFLVPAAVAAVLDGHHLRVGVQPASYGDLLDGLRLIRAVLWTGGYPLVGWIGFVLVGLWLARQRLGERRVQVRLLLVGAAIALAQPMLGWAYTALDGHTTTTSAGGLASFFDGRAHSNRTAWYVLGTGTAVAVLGATLILTSGRGRRWLWPLVCLGQLALTAYLAHLVLGQRFVWEWSDRSQPGTLAQMAVVALVVAAFATAATAWRWRFRRGPVESLLRALSG
jgi:uncharacterized membrane protein YeiB